MDNPKEFTTLEWCTGYAGVQLGLRRVIPNLRTIAYAEIEAFACANLVAKIEAGFLDAAPIWTDIKTFPSAFFRRKVDCLIAGYPCQPFSAAGKRQGADDPRHLWPAIRSAVNIIQPNYCFFENVEGHISLGLSTVISDLEEDGYRTAWGIFSAEECGAPHRRNRIFILSTRLGNAEHAGRLAAEGGGWADSASNRSSEGQAITSQSSGAGRPSELRSLPPDKLAYSISEGLQGHPWDERGEGRQDVGENRPASESSLPLWPARPNNPQHKWEPPRTLEPSVVRNTDGYPDGLDYAKLRNAFDNRTDELRLIGNGVVPQVVEKAWITLEEKLKWT